MTNNGELRSSSDFQKFERNIQLSWEEVINEQFNDMILACDDGEVKVHKLVLAASSSVFKNILKLNGNPHPFIYLSGVSFGNLKSLVEFMYQGKVNVAHTSLEIFLEVAEDLGLKGLSENKASKKYEILSPKWKKMDKKENDKEMAIDSETFLQIAEYFKFKGPYENIINDEDMNFFFNRKQTKESKTRGEKIENTENVLILREESTKDEMVYFRSEIDQENISEPKVDISVLKENTNMQMFLNDDKKSFQCDKCDSKFTCQSKLKLHFNDSNGFQCDKCDKKLTCQSKLRLHLNDGNGFQCDKCDKKFPCPNKLKLHLKISKHVSVKFSCSQCDYKAKNDDNLKTHIQSVHEGVPFYCEKCDKKFASQKTLIKHNSIHGLGEQLICDQCDYQSTSYANFKYHIDSTHAGVKYVCAECDYQAKSPGNLKVHVQSIHEGVRYPCGQCSHQATGKKGLRKHIEIIHNAVRYPCDQCTYKATQKRFYTSM